MTSIIKTCRRFAKKNLNQALTALIFNSHSRHVTDSLMSAIRLWTDINLNVYSQILSFSLNFFAKSADVENFFLPPFETLND